MLVESDTEMMVRDLIKVYPTVPPHEQKVLASTVAWWEGKAGDAVIMSYGGSAEDRTLAERLVAVELEGVGYKRAHFTFEHGMTHEAGWSDIMAKAKRLIQSGAVTILRNGYNNIVGHIIGDHGEYNTEIGRDDPNSQSITTWQCECWPAGTRVILADGSTKPIEQIETGDEVLTATGRVQKVKRRLERHYEGQLIGLRPTGFTETIWVTDNHKLFTADYDPKEAAEWVEGDYSYYPRPVVQENSLEIDVLEIVGEERYIEYEGRIYKRNKSYGSTRLPVHKRPKTPYSTRYSSVPAIIPFDEKFARLAGLYVAEGLTTDRGETRWCFNHGGREADLVQEVQDIVMSYGLKHRMEKDLTTETVTVDSFQFAQIFRTLFGTGSRTKKIDSRVLALPLDTLHIFLDAWMDGDGHRHGKDGRDSLGTSNIDLAMQARYILALLEKESVVRRIEENRSTLVPGGKDFHTVTWRRNGGRGQNRHFFAIDAVYQRMLSPETKEFTGTVFNIEVESEHSYVVYPGIASANCPWDQYAWQRTRQWKKYEGRPCSHVMALYWQSKQTPLDDYDPEKHGPMPGQKMGEPSPTPAGGAPPSSGSGPGGPPPGGATPGGPPSTPSPIESPAGLAPPGPSGVLPTPPMDQLAEQVPPVPGQTPAGMPANPNIVSVPGAKVPTPFNPIQFPGGTYSSAPEEPPNYREGTKEKHCGNCKMNDEGKCWGYGNKSIGFDNVCDSWYHESNEKTSAQETEFNPPEIVRLKSDGYGMAEGKSEAHGAGQYQSVPAGSTGEVLGQDPTTGWVEVIFPLEGGPLTPYHVKCFVDPGDIEHTSYRPPGPFIKRRT